MQIIWRNNKIKKRVEKMAQSNPIAERRLFQLLNAPCFLDIPSSAGTHFLKGEFEECFAVDFVFPARLICEPCGEYVKKDNQFDKSSIKSIEIVDIKTDYH